MGTMGGIEMRREIAEGRSTNDSADCRTGKEGDALRPWGVFEMNIETLP